MFSRVCHSVHGGGGVSHETHCNPHPLRRETPHTPSLQEPRLTHTNLLRSAPAGCTHPMENFLVDHNFPQSVVIFVEPIEL